MILSILPSVAHSQKHDAYRIEHSANLRKGTGLHHNDFCALLAHVLTVFRSGYAELFAIRERIAKVRLGAMFRGEIEPLRLEDILLLGPLLLLTLQFVAMALAQVPQL